MLTPDRDQRLLERLNSHPLLYARIESLLGVVEGAAGDAEQANVAERRVIEELRQMGNEVLTAWAECGAERQAVLAQAKPDWRAGGKKNCIGIVPLVGSKLWNRFGGMARVSSGRSVL